MRFISMENPQNKQEKITSHIEKSTLYNFACIVQNPNIEVNEKRLDVRLSTGKTVY